jgi:uncharacterized circularly permuted ATP-grasp superfamily protein
VHLFQYAADLARSPDGHWWVVNDRTQAPSGAGYALENRLIVSRVFPQLFHDLQVQHLAAFFEALRDALRRWSPRGGGPPLIVLLTPGPYNETYFEHALLARYLGFPLVEGSDLTVRDDCVWMKTIDGLTRVHAILRRQDDDYCDPLELRSDSALGVAGLTDVRAARQRDDRERARLRRARIGRAARLPAVAEPPAARRAAEAAVGRDLVARRAGRAGRCVARLDRLIIKPLERSPREPPLFAGDLSRDDLVTLRARIAARPHRYVAQEWVHVSQAPVLERGPPETLARAPSACASSPSRRRTAGT